MQIKNIHEDTGWFASYMDSPDGGNDPQGQALVECQALKIKQLQEVLENILSEIELCDPPKEYTEKVVLESIRGMIESIPTIEHSKGYFKWIG